jgi:hypothetical protein
MADSKQIEIFIIKREDHPVITDNDNAINAAKTVHLFYFQARVKDIGREPIGDLKSTVLNIYWQIANVFSVR